MNENSTFKVSIVIITQGDVLIGFNVTASLMNGTGALAASEMQNNNMYNM